MTHHRSEIIREVENDLIAARTRGYLKVPQHPTKTYTEVKADRARRWRAIRQGLWVLAAIGFAVLLWVLR